MEIFNNVQETDTETVFDNVLEAPQSVVSPKEARRTAAMASFVEMDLSSGGEDLMLELMETQKTQADRIERLGTTEIRRESAHRERLQEVKGLVALSRETSDEALRDGANRAAILASTQDIDEKSHYALELEAMRRVTEMAARDPHQRAMIQRAERIGDFKDYISERVAKDAIIERAIDTLGVEDRGTVQKVFDFTLDTLAFLDEGAGATGLIEDDRGFFQWLKESALPGQAVNEQSRQGFQLSTPELARLLPEMVENAKDSSTFLGYTVASEQERLLRKTLTDTPEAWKQNAEMGIELASVIPLKKGISVTRALVRAGDRETATNVAATAARIAETEGAEAAGKALGMTGEEVIEEMLPTAMVNRASDGVVSVASDAHQALMSARSSLLELGQANAKARLTDQETSLLEAREIKRVRREINRPVPEKDISVRYTSLDDGSTVATTEVVLGRAKGTGGYKTEASAQRALRTHGLAGEVFEDASGQWFARATLPVREEGLYVTPLDIRASNTLSRFFRGGGQQGDDMLHGSAQAGGRDYARVLRFFEDKAKNTYGKLGSKDGKVLDDLVTAQTDEAQDWMNEIELINAYERQTGVRKLPKNFQEAYSGVREIMDIEYLIRNNAVYREKAVKGFETVVLPNDMGAYNARVTRILGDTPPIDRVYDLTDGRHYTSKNPMTQDQWDLLRGSDYSLVKLEEAIPLPDGTHVATFLTKRNQMDVRPLSSNQIPYKAGVHRNYVDGWFSKAARRVTQSDTGQTLLTSPKAYRVFPTKRHADEWNEVMNEARDAYVKSSGDVAAVSAVFDGRPNFPTAQQFVDDVDKGAIDVKEVFETVRDGNKPTAYNTDELSARFKDEPGPTSIETLGRTMGSSVLSRRGDRLLGYDGKAAPVLSVGQTLNRAGLGASRIAGFGNFQIESAQRLIQNFSKYLNYPGSPERASVQQLLRTAEVKSDAPGEVAGQFESQRAIVNRQLGARTPFDDKVDNMNQHLERVLTKTDLGVKIYRWQQNKNPMDALRGFAFHTKLGVLNVAQFPLQVSSSVAASYISDLNTFQAWSSGVLLRFLNDGGKKSEAVLNSPAIRKALGIKDLESFKEMSRAMRNSGWLDVDNSHQLANTTSGLGIGGGRVRQKVETVKRGSTFFFSEPERWNRAVAFRIAWDEVGKKTGKAGSQMDGNFMRQVNDRADVYSFQMTAESRSAWQKGPASIPTQFMSYPIRMMEMVVGKKLTGKQKRKLIESQLIFYGSAGTPVTMVLADMIKNHTGETPQLGENMAENVLYAADRGLIDTLLNGMIGDGETDIKLSTRIGTGDFLPQLFRDLSNTSDFGETSAFDVFGGASFSVGKDFYGAAEEAIMHGVASQGKLGDPLGQRRILNVLRNISSVNNAYKAYMAFSYGQLYSKSGTLVTDNVTTPEAAALAVGLNIGDMDETSAMMNYMKDRSKIVEDTASEILKLRKQAAAQPDRSREFAESISTIMAMQDDPLLRREIIERVKRFDTGPESFSESVAKRYEKQQAEIRFQRRLREGQK